MKNKHKLIVAALLLHQFAFAQTNYPFQNTKLTTQERTEDLIQQMTLEEKIDLLAGYNDFYLHPCERLGIPAFKMADGPLGVSSWGLHGRATAFPAALSLASSWNRDLARRVGATYAEEWRARGIHFLLAPGVNNYRASKCARNFEYFGEDPFLASEMVVPFIEAVQDGGVIATIKHYVANDQEFDRYTVSTELSDRALHEIYLPPFKAAVQKAGVKAVMTGYNKVRGVYNTENKEMIDILKKDWGFQGMLMSDWACTYSAIEAANHGLDLEMGSKSWFNKEKMLPLIAEGKITEEVINDKVRRIYGTCMEMGFFDRPQKVDSIPVFNPRANKAAYEGACEGIVLLKNDDQILPIKQVKTIAVIGPTANPSVISDRVFNNRGIVYGGGGSSKVNPWYIVTDLDGIRNEFNDVEVLYAEGVSNQFKSNLFNKSKFKTSEGKNGLRAKYYTLGNNADAAVSDQLLQEQAIASGRAVDKKTKDQPNENTSQITADDLILEQIDGKINFEWWGYPHNQDKLGTDYKVEWEGYFEAEKTDSVLLVADAQGAYRLWIDGELLIDASKSESFYFGQQKIFVNKGDRKAVKLEFCNQRSLPSEIRFGYEYLSNIDFSEALNVAQKADLVVFCGGLDGSIELEGRDRPFELPYGQDKLINQLAAANPNLVVVLHAGGAVAMESWIDNAKAVVHAFYPGQEGGNALAHILSGKVNPSAKLPFTIEKKWEDSPAFGNYDETRKSKQIHYNEGIFTGYRGYDKNQTTPLFPFGFGLSYTTFAYGDLKVANVDKKNKTVEIAFQVTNSGNCFGGEIAQVYIHDAKASEPRPEKELKGFEKIWLAPGETKEITITLKAEDFMFYSAKKNKWVFEPGEFEVRLGASSNDIKDSVVVKL
ncbi:MAG: glycoside hydrolase family 3 protein [Tannerellaceae bacterium]